MNKLPPSKSAPIPGAVTAHTQPAQQAPTQNPKPQQLHSNKPAQKARDARNAPAPRGAARGDDDLMSKQQYQSMPSADVIKGKWKQHLGAAKIAWGELTEDELLKSEGHHQKLAGMIQQRYAITRDAADQQVKSFFAKHQPT